MSFVYNVKAIIKSTFYHIIPLFFTNVQATNSNLADHVQGDSKRMIMVWLSITSFFEKL